jgi:hypothetical protein
MIWEKDIAANANLSGLKLLHVHGWYRSEDLIQVLRCLPILKSLVLGNGSGLEAEFFGEFVPMDPKGTTGLNRPPHEGQIPAVLCPMLKNLLIGGFDPTEQRELIPVLKEVVTLRAVYKSPLKTLAFSDSELGRRIELGLW